MFGTFWRLALLGLCVLIWFIPFVNLVMIPVIFPLSIYLIVSVASRVWRRSAPSHGLSS